MRRLTAIAKRILGRGSGVDYRAVLFDELRAYLGDRKPRRVLEIGPKDGQDTRRLLTLEPVTLTLVDLPRMRETNEQWLRELDAPCLEYVSANLMYSGEVLALPPYDVVWCTGVLYHNPEQLRMVRRLHDLTLPGGVLVIESATIRRRALQDENCVEVIYPPTKEYKLRYHVSMNVTHLPSARAVQSWLDMVGFARVVRSGCHRRSSRALAKHRAAYLATKPLEPKASGYYSITGDDFEIGSAL